MTLIIDARILRKFQNCSQCNVIIFLWYIDKIILVFRPSERFSRYWQSKKVRGWGTGHLIAYHTGCDKQMMHYHCCQYFCMCVCILWLWQTQRLFPAQTGWLTISLRVNHITPCIVVGSQASSRPTTSPSPFMSQCYRLGWVHSRAVSVIKSGEPGLREERERESVLSTPLMI